MEEQLSAIEEFVCGQDVFVSLPTGFGKSVIYGILPTIFDRMKVHKEPTSIALIMSPLASLMVDQKARSSSICKRAAFVTDDWLQY